MKNQEGSGCLFSDNSIVAYSNLEIAISLYLVIKLTIALSKDNRGTIAPSGRKCNCHSNGQ